MKIALLYISFFVSPFVFADGWTQKSGIPAEGRHRTTGWSIGSKGYIGLGHYNSGPIGNVAKSDIWEYDPVSDSWTQKADYGGGETYGATAFTIGNFAYVGAHVYAPEEYYKFDPIQNTWTLISPCVNCQSDKTAFAINGKGYHMTTNAIYEYDPQLDTWNFMVNTPVQIYSWSKSFTVNNKAYILAAGSGALIEYKPTTNEFAMREPYPGDGQGGWITFETKNRGYVATGYITFLNPTSRQIWEYNPELDKWEQYEELPGSTRRFAASFTINNKGYLGTGTNGNNFKDFWEFDPAQALSVDNAELKNNIRVFPNPSTEFIVFSSSYGDKSFKVEIFDLNGKLVNSEMSINGEVNIQDEDVGKGTFVYKLTVSNLTIKTGKIIFE